MAIEPFALDALNAHLEEVIGVEEAAAITAPLRSTPWDRLATKEDLGRFATREDLERFATREDLERFPTKEDLARELERFVTKDDLARELENFENRLMTALYKLLIRQTWLVFGGAVAALTIIVAVLGLE